MTNEPREQRMYTREEVLTIADAWGDLNYWYGKLRGYADARHEPTDQQFHLDGPGLEPLIRAIPYDISRELEERGYSAEIIQELSRKVDGFDPEVSDEEFTERHGQES